VYRFGFHKGFQRYRCKTCGGTFSDIPERPLDDLRVSPEKAHQVIHLPCEGMGIRACERITSLNRSTVLNILETAGRKCARLLDESIEDVSVESVQCDELFAFVYCKQCNNHDNDPNVGEQYTYLAIDRDSKLILSRYVGKRCGESTDIFISDLRKRVKGRCQITTDGLQSYVAAMVEVFGGNVDFAQQTKTYANHERTVHNHRKYSPEGVISVKIKVHIGEPDWDLIRTSHVERVNLTVRLFTRRFTRLTLGYSKKLSNLRHAVALFVAHYNFCRVHSAHGRTPAQVAGLTDHVWKVPELLQQSDAP
jgi:hypothetical protein